MEKASVGLADDWVEDPFHLELRDGKLVADQALTDQDVPYAEVDAVSELKHRVLTALVELACCVALSDEVRILDGQRQNLVFRLCAEQAFIDA